MNKKDLDLLERAFDCEVKAALHGTPTPMQTRAIKRADALVEAGHLERATEMWRGVQIEGYELTHLGRMTYCAHCDPNDVPES